MAAGTARATARRSRPRRRPHTRRCGGWRTRPRTPARRPRPARARVAAGLEARAEQGAVWDEVAAKSSRLDIASATGAMHDIYEGRRDGLDAFAEAIAARDCH